METTEKTLEKAVSLIAEHLIAGVFLSVINIEASHAHARLEMASWYFMPFMAVAILTMKHSKTWVWSLEFMPRTACQFLGATVWTWSGTMLFDYVLASGNLCDLALFQVLCLLCRVLCLEHSVSLQCFVFNQDHCNKDLYNYQCVLLCSAESWADFRCLPWKLHLHMNKTTISPV